MAHTAESYRANSAVGLVQILAEEIDKLHADVGVLAKEAQQIATADLGDLRRLRDLGGHLVRLIGEHGAQAQHLAREATRTVMRLPLSEQTVRRTRPSQSTKTLRGA